MISKRRAHSRAHAVEQVEVQQVQTRCWEAVCKVYRSQLQRYRGQSIGKLRHIGSGLCSSHPRDLHVEISSELGEWVTPEMMKCNVATTTTNSDVRLAEVAEPEVVWLLHFPYQDNMKLTS